MLYFFDSSALAKLFLLEQYSDAVTLFVENAPRDSLICSQLALLEVRSAIHRKRMLGEVSATHADQALTLLQAEMQRWRVMPVDAQVLAYAANCLSQHALLRSLDALQLGSAILAAEDDSITFIAADKRLLQAAASSGFSVKAPADL